MKHRGRPRHPRRSVRPGADLQGRKPDFQSRRSQAEFSDQEAEHDHQDALAVNSMCAITMPRNHATADGGMNPTTQPTMIWEHSQHQRPTSEVFLQAVDVSGHKPVPGSGRRVRRPKSLKERMENQIAKRPSRWLNVPLFPQGSSAGALVREFFNQPLNVICFVPCIRKRVDFWRGASGGWQVFGTVCWVGDNSPFLRPRNLPSGAIAVIRYCVSLRQTLVCHLDGTSLCIAPPLPTRTFNSTV